MKLSVVGSGYVGTTIAACFAELGHDVTAIDIDESVVDSLNKGNATIHEPGLDDLLAEHVGDRLRATTDYSVTPETDATFLALPTPSKADGSLDTAIILAAAQSVGEALARNPSHISSSPKAPSPPAQPKQKSRPPSGRPPVAVRRSPSG